MCIYAEQATSHTVGFLRTLYPDLSLSALYGRLMVIPMIGINEVKGEVFTLDDAKELNVYAKKMGLKGIGMWSLDRDRLCTK